MAAPHSIRTSIQVTDSASRSSSANPPKDVLNGRIDQVSPSYCASKPISPLRSRTGPAPVALPKLRHCTMGYLHPYVKPNYAYPTAPRLGPELPRVPFLRLQGRWLQQAGFAIGTPVRILVSPGRLVFEVDKSS